MKVAFCDSLYIKRGTVTGTSFIIFYKLFRLDISFCF